MICPNVVPSGGKLRAGNVRAPPLLAFANDDDDDDEDDDDDDDVDEADDAGTKADADVDWKDDGNAEDDVAAVTVIGCPDFDALAVFCNFDRSVFVLLAAVTSDASLPTRTVHGDECDQDNTPKPVNNINKTNKDTTIDIETIAMHFAEHRAAKSFRKFIGAE